MSGKTYLTLTAITFEIILASTLIRDIGLQFSISVRSYIHTYIHTYFIRPKWAFQNKEINNTIYTNKSIN